MAIALRAEHRRQGIGTRLAQWLIERAASESIPAISLNVAKDNVALGLYRKLGFVEHADRGDALTLIRRT